MPKEENYKGGTTSPQLLQTIDNRTLAQAKAEAIAMIKSHTKEYIYSNGAPEYRQANADQTILGDLIAALVQINPALAPLLSGKYARPSRYSSNRAKQIKDFVDICRDDCNNAENTINAATTNDEADSAAGSLIKTLITRGGV